MGYVYQRENRLWFAYYDHHQRLQHVATEFVVGQEREAEAELQKTEDQLQDGGRTKPTPIASAAQVAPITVRAYAKAWSDGRIEQGLATAADEFTRLRLHA